MSQRPSPKQCLDLIQDFKIEKHLDEKILIHGEKTSAKEYYKQRLNEMRATLQEIPWLLQIEKFEQERLENLFYAGIQGFDQLRDYIRSKKPIEYPLLDEETINNVTWAFVYMTVDKYKKGQL